MEKQTSITSHLERDVLRERERAARERALLLGKMQETSPPPIFSEPIKVDPSLEDETSKRVKSTLGDFHGILNTDPKNLIGISRSSLMAIHNSKNSSSSTGYSASKSNDGNSDTARKPNVLNGQHKSSHWNTHETEIKHLGTSTHQRSKDYVKTQNVDNKLKKKIQLSTSNSSSAVGGDEPLDKNRSSNYKSKKSSAFQNVEKCEERLSGKTATKENVAVTEQAESKNDKQPQVESILEEMRLNIPPPLTAICSPGRDEPFHFPITEEPMVPFNTQESDHSAGVEQCTDSTNSLIMLREDLEVSESEEEVIHDKLTDPDMLFNSTLESPDLNSLQPPPPIDAMSSSAKSSGESEMSEPEIAIAVPSNESVKKNTKIAKISRPNEKKQKQKHKSNHNRSDKVISADFKQETENEKTDSTLTSDRGDRTKNSQQKENRKSLSPMLSDLEMNLVHDAISEETLTVCPPIQPICVSPMSPISQGSQETGLPLSSQTEKSVKSSAIVHKEKITKKKRNDSNHSSDSRALLRPSSNDKIGADPTITPLLPANSAAVSCDGVKSDSEKLRRHKHKQEKRETKEKHLKNDENKKSHKRTNSSEKKTYELSSRSSTLKQLPKVEEESKVPKGNDAQKRKANFHRPKSKKFILDSSDDSDSEGSDFDKPTREVASVAKNLGHKTSQNDVENIAVNSNCSARPDDEQATSNHSELKPKEALKRVPTETCSKNVALVTSVELDKTMKEVSFDKPVNPQLLLDKPLCIEAPSLKLTKCQSQVHMNINESDHSTIPSFLVSIDLKFIERLPKLKEHNKLCEKNEVKAEDNLNTSSDISHLSQTEEKVSKESSKRKHSEEKKYKHKKLKVTATPSPKTTLPVKKEKPGDEFWDAKITPKSSERCDSPSSLCSFSSQQSHRSISHHGKGSDRGKKERKTKDSSLSEQKLKGHTPSKESKLDEERKHKPKKEKGDESIKNKEKGKSGTKYQNFENSQEGGLTKSSQVYKGENAYRETTRQDECASVSHDDLAEWNNSNSSWLLPKQGMIECDKYMNEAKKLKHEADMETVFRVQAMKYLDAVLCFILAGMAKEKSHCQVSQTYTLYKETLDLIRYIASKFQKNAQSSSQNGSMDTKLYVLSLRCQSLLYLKLYRLRRGEVREIHKTLSKVQKQKPNHRPLQTATVTTLSQPSPGHLKGGMPSPHSPTPSPAGSVASVGSQSSGYSSSEVNGTQCRNVNTDSIINNPLPSVPSGHQQTSQDHHDIVSVPHSTYNMLQRQSTHLGNLHLCHDLWEQADIHISHGNCKEFFKLLDSKCGRLTLHSTFPELVEYIRKGLGMLKEET